MYNFTFLTHTTYVTNLLSHRILAAPGYAGVLTGIETKYFTRRFVLALPAQTYILAKVAAQKRGKYDTINRKRIILNSQPFIGRRASD